MLLKLAPVVRAQAPERVQSRPLNSGSASSGTSFNPRLGALKSQSPVVVSTFTLAPPALVALSAVMLVVSNFITDCSSGKRVPLAGPVAKLEPPATATGPGALAPIVAWAGAPTVNGAGAGAGAGA